MNRDGYKQVANALAGIVKQCRAKYGEDWEAVRDKARAEMRIHVTDNLNERSVALAGAMEALDNNDDEAAMVFVGAAYDPDRDKKTGGENDKQG